MTEPIISHASPINLLSHHLVNHAAIPGCSCNSTPGELRSFRRSQSLQVASSLGLSLKYAWQGVSYAFLTQRNFRIHLAIATVALGLSIYLQLSLVEITIICLTIGAVLVMELLNTALEAVVDLSVGQTYHYLAKIAKDCGAGAVLIAALVALTVAGCLICPPLVTLVSTLYTHT